MYVIKLDDVRTDVHHFLVRYRTVSYICVLPQGYTDSFKGMI